MWNMIFLFNKNNKLTNFHKGILYCAIILCVVWMIGNVLRRFSFYSDYSPALDGDPSSTMHGSNTCTLQNGGEHLYWNFVFYSNPGMNANWFMYIMLWFIPGLLIPGEMESMITIISGFILSNMYVRYKKQTGDIAPSLWCLSSVPSLFIYIIYKSLTS